MNMRVIWRVSYVQLRSLQDVISTIFHRKKPNTYGSVISGGKHNLS